MGTEEKSLENLLVWSAHRVGTLARCERRYYHNYIGSWQGWDSSSTPESQCAYRLKHLTTPELEIGNYVHRQIPAIFAKVRAGRPINPASEITIVQAQFRDFVEHSRHRKLEDVTAKRKRLLLHEMGEDLTPQAMARFDAWIELLFRNFFAFPDVKRLLADPTPLVLEFLDPPGFEIGHELGVPARPKTDAVFTDPDDNTVVVADWKCGAPSEEHRRQGLIYALFISSRMKLPPAQPLEIRFYYLGTGNVEAFRYSEEEKEEMLWQVGESFAELQRKSDDPVLNVGPENRFLPHLSKGRHYCVFRLMCEPFLRSKLAAQQEVA